jgi:hypothetical protein
VWTLLRIIPSKSVALLIKYRKTAAESLDTKYDLEPATCHKLDIDSGRTKGSIARLTYELRNYVTTLLQMSQKTVWICNVKSINNLTVNALHKGYPL